MLSFDQGSENKVLRTSPISTEPRTEAQFTSNCQLRESPLVLASFRNSQSTQIRKQAIPIQTFTRSCSSQSGPLITLAEPRSNEEMLLILVERKHFSRGEISHSLPTAQGYPHQGQALPQQREWDERRDDYSSLKPAMLQPLTVMIRSTS